MDDYADGLRMALIVALLGKARRKRERDAQKRRAAELMAVAMLCDRRRLRELGKQEAEFKLLMLRTYQA